MLELQFKKPVLEDKEMMQEYIRRYPSRNCERTFANELLWAHYYETGYTVIHNALVFHSM